MKDIIETVSAEITDVLHEADQEALTELAEKIHYTNQIFISGTGRSGLIGKAIAMRLMHTGYDVYVTGETITPSIEEDNLLLIISGSGTTANLANFAQKAKEVGAQIALVTTNKQSVIGEISDVVVDIPAVTKHQDDNESRTIQPLGNQFDQAAHLLLDAMIVYLIENYRDHNQNVTMKNKHTNLE